MLKYRCCALILGLLAAGSFAAHGQALPTATRGGALQVGFGLSTGNTDIYDKNLTGVTIYAAFDLSEHLGAEADVHYMALVSPNDLEEHEYLIGPRYVFHYGRFDPYIKLQAGIGQTKLDGTYFTVPNSPGSFFAYAIGGGVDAKFSHHLNVRVDLDYQKWPGFEPHGLTPYVATIGFAYRFR